MPQIIARTIADLIAKAETEKDIREAIALGFQTARDSGYRPRSEKLYAEVCEELRRLAAAETGVAERERLMRAVGMIGRISNDSQPDFRVLDE